jgi:hypothetical protein
VLALGQRAGQRGPLPVDRLLGPREQHGGVLAEVLVADLVPAVALRAGDEQLRRQQLVLDAAPDAGQHDHDQGPADQHRYRASNCEAGEGGDHFSGSGSRKAI